MPFNKITDKTIPTFWAFLLLFGLLGVFIVDSYNANKPIQPVEKGQEIKAEIVEEEFTFEGERNIPAGVHQMEGAFKGEIYSYKGRVEKITDFYLIIRTEEGELVKVNIDEEVKFYQVVEKGEVPMHLDFNDLKKGEEVEINFLKKEGEIEFKTYAAIAKRYEE